MFERIRHAVDALKATARDLDPVWIDGRDAAALFEVVSEGERVCAVLGLSTERSPVLGPMWRWQPIRTVDLRHEKKGARSMPNRALITGASRGLGLALARALAADGWELVVDARGEHDLRAAATDLGRAASVHAVPGDVADEAHRLDLAAAVDALGGGLDLLVHNASRLGPSPQPSIAKYPLDELERVYAANVFGPLRLTQLLLPCMGPDARIVSITSDAAVEPYEGWGGYGSSKAALEQWTRVLAAERPDLRVYVVDPGDMRTQMHQDAFPGEDISDRPLPEASVPGLLTVIEGDLPSGRYEARAVVPAELTAGVAP